MYKKLAPYFTHDDGRGQIVGVVNEGEWREVNSISSEAGSVRGNHYHESTIELFLILSGKIEVTVQRVEDRVLTRAAKTFIVGPGDVFLVRKT